MAVVIKPGNVLESDADGILLTIDGRTKELPGKVARQFAKAYPEAWTFIETELEYPISLGSVEAILLPEESTCRQKFALMAATLHHAEDLTDDEMRSVASNAVREAMKAAQRYRIKRVALGAMSGGWRLPFEEALKLTVQAYFKLAYHGGTWPEFEISVYDEDSFRAINANEVGRYLSVYTDETMIRITT